MRIRHISIRRFRGIRELDWTVTSDMVCLIGHCDSCKSTILDAIEYALWPRWSLSFTDDDFYGASHHEPIVIRVTIVQPPDTLLQETAFGLYARGWDCDACEVADEPEGDTEIALTIQLRVDASLEPSWEVVTDRHEEGKPIGVTHRQNLGVASLGMYLDRDLSWSKGSALSRASSGEDGISEVLAEASRSLRTNFTTGQVPKFDQYAQELAASAVDAGVSINHLRPGLDLRSAMLSTSVLSLFEGDVPLRQSGLGTRRLVSLVMQKQMTKAGAILLVDELEHGLEPFRVRTLIRYLRPGEHDRHQTFSCTHSPTALAEHQAEEIHVVRNDDGQVTVQRVSPDLQGVVRGMSEAFFSSRVVVCEGSTEWGLSRALEQYWVEKKGHEPIAYANSVFAYAASGTGTAMSRYARGMASLGYQTALWCDSDEKVPSYDALVSAGVSIIQWTGSVCTEQRLCQDLPLEALEELLALACQILGSEQPVYDAICARVESPPESCRKLRDLVAACGEDAVRAAMGKAAAKKEWYKSTTHGQALGEIVTRWLDRVPDSDTAIKLEKLEQWVYG